MKRGTPEWGKHLAGCVQRDTGVHITKNIVAVRCASFPQGAESDQLGWCIEIGDVRTGKSIELRFTPSGKKVGVIR